MPDPSVVEEPPVVVEEPTITVDVAPKPEPEKKPDDAAPQGGDDLARQIQALKNQLAGAQRINQRLQRQIEGVAPAAPAPAEPPPMAQDELDRLVEQGRWKDAVGKIAEEKAQRLYEQRVALQQQQEALTQRQTALEQAKAEVLTKYPDLDETTGNPDSEVAKAYAQVLNEHPQFLRNEYGPVLAMYEMEKRLGGKSSGTPVPATPRRPAALATSLPPSRGAVARPNEVVLTKEQKDYWETQLKPSGIPLEEYARNIRGLTTEGGISA